MISESPGDAKTIALPVAPAQGDALARCAVLIASEPELAEALATSLAQDTFAAALNVIARERGIDFDAATEARLAALTPTPSGCRLMQWSLSMRRGWQPFALEFGPYGPELVWGCGAARAGQVFHELTAFELRALPLNRFFAVRTPLSAAFVAVLVAEALPVAGVIYHMSRCGSTLVAEALKVWPGMRVLSEPSLLDSAIMLARSGHDPDWMLLRGVIAALAQPAGKDSAVCFKLDAWHTLALVEIRRVVAAPWLFVYRDPVEVMVSHARAPGRHTVDGLVPDMVVADGNDLAIEHTPETYAARVIGAICAAIVPHADAARLLNYNELPAALTTRLPAALGLNPKAPDLAHLAEVLKHHAKQPHEAFSDDRAAKQAEASAALRRRVTKWIEPHYAALEAIRLQCPTRIQHLQLPLACDLEALRADLTAVAPGGWSPHFNTGYYSGDWSGIPLRGIPGTHMPLYADPNRSDFADTATMALCDYVPKFLAQLDCPIESVRFLRLAAGAQIHEHRDWGLCYEEGVARLHVPVHTNPDVDFRLDGQPLSLSAGECWYINFDLPHRITNHGANDRVHLVIDIRVNPWLQALFGATRAMP